MSLIAAAITFAVLVGALLVVIAFLPTATGLPPQFHDALINVIGYVKPFSLIINLDALFTVVGIVLAMDLVLILVRIAIWVYKLILTRVS